MCLRTERHVILVFTNSCGLSALVVYFGWQATCICDSYELPLNCNVYLNVTLSQASTMATEFNVKLILIMPVRNRLGIKT